MENWFGFVHLTVVFTVVGPLNFMLPPNNLPLSQFTLNPCKAQMSSDLLRLVVTELWAGDYTGCCVSFQKVSQWCEAGIYLLASQAVDKCQSREGVDIALHDIEAFLGTAEEYQLSSSKEFYNQFELILPLDVKVMFLGYWEGGVGGPLPFASECPSGLY